MPGSVAGGYVVDELREDNVVQVSAPRGSFTLRQGNEPVVFLSAGIGITPVLAMLHALVAEMPERDIWWLHGARNGREDPFAEEVRRLLAKLPHGHRCVCYSSPEALDRPGEDFDIAGHLSSQVLEQNSVPLRAEFYICGPTAFMTALVSGLTEAGVPLDRIYTETFGGGLSVTPGVTGPVHRTPHIPEGPPGAGPAVSFARSGLAIRWDEKYKNLLEIAESCDVSVRWSCRSGVCHTCETALVSGAITYNPEPLDASEDGNILICCSRPVGDVVIDL
jgi:ferredoxin-NADP reductase